MRILLSGASGFIGQSLISHFSKKKWEIVPLLHEMASSGAMHWRSGKGLSLEGFDAAIHLAGEPIAIGYWSNAKKQKILNSRAEGTAALALTFAQLSRPPSIFISASAAGIYGDRGEELLDEGSAPGKGFLAHVCKVWEEESRKIASSKTRSIQARFGMVLGSGGFLKKMIPLYRLGLGGRLSRGEQWVSWVTIADLVSSIDHILQTKSLHGPVNIVSPHAVRQKEFSRILAEVLHRPAFFHLPAWLLRLRFGAFADEVLLASQRVVPHKLCASGFRFKDSDLKGALLTLLSRSDNVDD